MKIIPLGKGYEAIIDDDDYDKVSQFSWGVLITKWTQYGRKNFWINKKCQTVYLHNFIVPPPEGFTNDHIDRNGLNCQKSNLRFATKSQQMMNRKVPNSSGYRGVYWYKAYQKWHVMISTNYEVRSLGYYDDLIEAAKAYDKQAKREHGEFAVLNFPNE